LGEMSVQGSKVRRRPRKKPSLAAILAVVIVASVLGVLGGLYIAGLPSIVSIGDIFRPCILTSKPIVRILMLGEDKTGSKKTGRHGLSDTLVVLAINNQTNPKQIRAISIPRDTRVEIPGHGICKINSANAFGGPELSKEVIQNILGVDIDYYLATSTEGLRGLVDMVGGVYIVVDENMNYDDRHQNLHIHLKAGPEKQLLKGLDAEGYVRFRHDRVGDSGWKIVDGKKVAAGRIARQQYFMRALANRILALPTRRERADVLSKAYEKGYILSDLKLKDWGALAEFMKDVDPDKMGMAVLPGEPGMKGHASYWMPDDAKIPEVVAKQMRFEGGTDEDLSASVEVLNGCGVVGAAGSVAEKLQKAGFQVTKQGNAPGFTYDRCRVITRKGNTPGVQRIASLLKCTDIREESKGKGLPDVTVIVGRDYSDSGSM